MNKRSSFENAKYELYDVRNYTNNNNIALVGYKDRIYDDDDKYYYDEGEISTEEGQKFAKEEYLLFFEISMFDKFKIDECFNSLINKIYENDPDKNNYKSQIKFRLKPINKFLNM